MIRIIDFTVGMLVLVIALLITNAVAAPRSAPHAKGWAPPIAGLTGAPLAQPSARDSGASGGAAVRLSGPVLSVGVPWPAVAVLPAVIPPLALSGTATWYRWHRGEAAAGPLLRQALGRDWRGQSVTVCAQACVTVRLTDWCSCLRGRRLVDLDARSFARLAPLSAGVVAVTIGIRQATPTAPPTDVAP